MLVLTMMSLSSEISSGIAMNIQVEGFKTEESCLKAAEKAKKDITEQITKYLGSIEEVGDQAKMVSQELYIPIAICVKKD